MAGIILRRKYATRARDKAKERAVGAVKTIFEGLTAFLAVEYEEEDEELKQKMEKELDKWVGGEDGIQRQLALMMKKHLEGEDLTKEEGVEEGEEATEGEDEQPADTYLDSSPEKSRSSEEEEKVLTEEMFRTEEKSLVEETVCSVEHTRKEQSQLSEEEKRGGAVLEQFLTAEKIEEEEDTISGPSMLTAVEELPSGLTPLIRRKTVFLGLQKYEETPVPPSTDSRLSARSLSVVSSSRRDSTTADELNAPIPMSDESVLCLGTPAKKTFPLITLDDTTITTNSTPTSTTTATTSATVSAEMDPRYDYDWSCISPLMPTRRHSE